MLGQLLLGRYRVTRALDEGGMSKVYLARQADPARDVVVKVLKEQLQTNAKARDHFRREIFITSRFSHPHAVAYYDSSTSPSGAQFLVMEYLRGTDLNALLHREKRFTPERAGRLLAQLCDVLQAAHDHGIVHRDIKPGNVMVINPGTPHESVKLMDFGLAKMSSLFYISADDLVTFSLPAASGTPEYISPEMVRGTDLDGRGDLYSVGVLLFEMLTGRRPFDHPTIEQLMLAHLEEPAPRFADVGLPQLVPPPIEQVVQMCLEKSPDRRPSSAWELALAYERALGRRITTGRSGVASPRAAGQATPPPGSLKGAFERPNPAAAADRNVLRQSFDMSMPEAMAMLKLKGFIYDLGGDVLDSVPGMIRVRLAEPAEKKPSGLMGWIGGSAKAAQASSATELELHMERKDPKQPSHLTVTLVMKPPPGLVTESWRGRCASISRDLQAYLMGR